MPLDGRRLGLSPGMLSLIAFHTHGFFNEAATGHATKESNASLETVASPVQSWVRKRLPAFRFRHCEGVSRHPGEWHTLLTLTRRASEGEVCHGHGSRGPLEGSQTKFLRGS